MYKTITDPYTQTSYSIKSKKGIDILKNYLNYSMRGGASASAAATDDVLEKMNMMKPSDLKNATSADFPGVDEGSFKKWKKQIERGDNLRRHTNLIKPKIEYTQPLREERTTLNLLTSSGRDETQNKRLVTLAKIGREWKRWKKWANWKTKRGHFFPNDTCCTVVVEDDTANVVPVSDLVETNKDIPGEEISSTSNEISPENKGKWIETTDPASGRKYWWNSETRERTWDNPKKTIINAVDESWECVCGGKNKPCSCKDTSTEETKQCSKIATRNAETKAELAKVRAENELLRETVIRLSRKLTHKLLTN